MKRTTIIFIIAIMSININAGLLQKPFVYIAKKLSTKTLSEGTEAAIRISCRATAETAVKLAAKYGDDAGKYFAKYGDDAVRITAKYGDDAVKLFSKYGDDLMKISGKYGDEGARVFIRHQKELKPLIAKYGDDIIKPYIKHPGLGDRLVKTFGKDAIKISGKMTDDAAIVMLKNAERANKRSLINKILFHKNGKINKAVMLTLLSCSAIAGGAVTHKAEGVFHFSSETIQPEHWISLSVLLLIICIYIVVKVKLKKNKGNQMKRIIITAIVLIGILSGCATSGRIADGRIKSSYQTDKDLLIELTSDFVESYKCETNPLVKIVYCKKISNIYKDFLIKYEKQISFEETISFKNRVFELNKKAEAVIEKLDDLIKAEKENLKYSRFQYEKKRAIKDLKFVNKVVRDEKSKRFNYFGLRVDVKNAAKAWKFCERVIKSRKAPEMLRMKAGDHKIELMNLMRGGQELMCREYPNVKNYCEYKDYPNWDVEKAAILKYMEGKTRIFDLAENKKIEGIKIVSVN